MNYAVEMGSGAVIYTPSFIKIGSEVGWEVVREDTYRGTQTSR
jgi:hypothetical protein